MGGGGSGSRGGLHDLDRIAMNDALILTLVVFVPFAGALILLIGPRRDSDLRWGALIISIIEFVLSLFLPARFQSHTAGFQFQTDAVWIPSPNIHYHLGIDGISLW